LAPAESEAETGRDRARWCRRISFSLPAIRAVRNDGRGYDVVPFGKAPFK